MHRLTCNEADRLARDLDQAATLCHHGAAEHANKAAAMAIIGEHLMAEYHRGAAAGARQTAGQLADYADRLRARQGLWEAPPEHHRAGTLQTSRAELRSRRKPW